MVLVPLVGRGLGAGWQAPLSVLCGQVCVHRLYQAGCVCTCQSLTQGSLGRAVCMTQGDLDCVSACHLCFLTYLGRCCHPLTDKELRLRDLETGVSCSSQLWEAEPGPCCGPGQGVSAACQWAHGTWGPGRSSTSHDHMGVFGVNGIEVQGP